MFIGLYYHIPQIKTMTLLPKEAGAISFFKMSFVMNPVRP